MRRALLAAVMVLGLSGLVFTVGCGGSDDDNNGGNNNGSSIVGTWLNDAEGWSVTINANGTWVDSTGATGSWSTSGSTISLTEEGFGTVNLAYSLSGNTLTITSAETGTAVFTRQ